MIRTSVNVSQSLAKSRTCAEDNGYKRSDPDLTISTSSIPFIHYGRLYPIIRRNYPYRSFTLFVTILGLAFLALFSFINLASSGFSLVVEYTTDPNITVTGVPKIFASKMKPSCQPSPIDGQTKIATTNNALFYTVTSVQSEGNRTLLPSLIYLNNPLESCNVTQVAIYMEHSDARTAAQLAVSGWGITILGKSTCRVELNGGPVIVNTTAQWDPYPASITTFSGYTTFLGRDKDARASLYWGESLLANHRVHLNNEMDGIPNNQSKYEITFTVRDSHRNITDLSFFSVDARSIAFGVQEDGSPFRTIVFVDDKRTVGSLISGGDMLFLAADNLVKSFLSVILTDLGQIAAEQNILRDASLLQHFTSNFSQILTLHDTRGSGPILEDYNTLKDTTGPLVVNPSTLAVNHLCNVPQRKPWSELVVSILIADLVFMRALWSIFTLATSSWVKSKDKTGNWCEGCVKVAALQDEDKQEERPNVDSRNASSQVLEVPLLHLESRAPQRNAD